MSQPQHLGNAVTDPAEEVIRQTKCFAVEPDQRLLSGPQRRPSLLANAASPLQPFGFTRC
jgi:hypothetical protein